MWPFPRHREEQKKKHIAQKVVVSLIIGGAIGSIIGTKLLKKHGAETDDEGEDRK